LQAGGEGVAELVGPPGVAPVVVHLERRGGAWLEVPAAGPLVAGCAGARAEDGEGTARARRGRRPPERDGEGVGRRAGLRLGGEPAQEHAEQEDVSADPSPSAALGSSAHTLARAAVPLN